MVKQKMVKVIKDPEQLELFENPNYARILHIMRNGELTVKEIHENFNKDYEDRKTLTSVYRYMEKLVESDLVFVSKEELKRGNLIESYYSRTAIIFFLEDERTEENVINAASELFQEIYNLDKESKEELHKLLRKWAKDAHQNKLDFYNKRGKEISRLEKRFGFKPVLYATDIIREFLYIRQNPELLKKMFEILEG